MIPRGRWFSPSGRLMRLSPDGTTLAVLERRGEAAHVSVFPVDAAGEPTHRCPAPAGVRHLEWSADGDYLALLFEDQGDERRKLALWFPGEARPRAAPPGLLVLGLAGPRAAATDGIAAWTVEPRSGSPELSVIVPGTFERRTVLGGREIRSALLDPDWRPRVVVSVEPADGLGIRALDADGRERARIRVPLAHDRTTVPVCLEPDGDAAWLLCSAVCPDAAGTADLCRWDFRTGALARAAGFPSHDVSEVVLDPSASTPQAVGALVGDGMRWICLDDVAASGIGKLDARYRGDLRVLDRSSDDRHWLVLARPHRCDATWVLYRHDLGTVRELAPASTELAAAPRMRTRHFLARTADGLAPHCFLSRGRPAGGRPPPLVVCIHGGPWLQDRPEGEPLHWWLADRGYAVLRVNYRGSAGYGARFLEAGNRAWAGSALDDILCAVRAVLDAGNGDRERVGVLGRSFGGYMALMAAAAWPGAVRCAVSLYGPTDLAELMDAMPAEWSPSFASVERRIGSWRTVEGRQALAEASPAGRLDDLACPTLLVHGERDRRVPSSQSVRLARALAARGRRTTCLTVPGEGHGFEGVRARVAAHAAIEMFLSTWLGGELEPPGRDAAGGHLHPAVDTGGLPGLDRLLAGSAVSGPGAAIRRGRPAAAHYATRA